MSFRSILRRGVVALSATALVTGGFSGVAQADTSPPPGQPETLTATPLSTWQTNGTVWSMAIVNGVTYVGGNFTKVRPPGAAVGQDEVERRYLAAFDTRTGDLLPWAPRLSSNPVTLTTPDKTCTSLGNNQYECATVFSLRPSPDNTMLYVGGAFNFIDGKVRSSAAAFNLPSGALNTVFKPSISGRVNAMAPTNDSVFMGGSFTKVGGQPRTRLAAVSKSNQLLPWAPSADKTVTSMAMAPDQSRVVVGGKFDNLNGTARHGIGAIYTADTGARAPWAGNQMASIAYATSLTTFGDLVYSTGDAAGSVSEGIQAIDPYTGNTVWDDACRGASHSMAVVRGVVYSGSHAHDCGGMVDGFGEQYQGYPTDDRDRYKLRAEVPFGDGRAQLLHWFPHTDDGNGARAMATDGNFLWIGGEFTFLNDTTRQQGLTRFTFKDQGGVNLAPLRPKNLVASADSPERVRISWQATPDRDNRTLEYWLIKNDNVSNPIAKQTMEGRPWLQPWMSYVDTSVTPGQTYNYSVRAVDPDGKVSVRSLPINVTVPVADVAAGAIAKNDGAAVNYRFEESAGATKAASSVGTRSANKGTGATFGAPGALGNGLTLSGSSGGVVVDPFASYAKRQNSVEAMFKTTTTTGGVLASVGNSTSLTGSSGDNRNNLYMTNDGRLAWGQKPDNFNFPSGPSSAQKAVTTTGSYNNGAWHHVVATFEPGTGARIYVDGALAAEDRTLNWSRTINSYLRIGGDRTTGWPNKPASDWWKGSIDEVASYDYPLSQEQVKAHADNFLSRPAAPTGLSGSATGEDSIQLTWTSSQTATSYRVIRGGQQVATTTTPSFADTGLTPDTAYQYSVIAENANGLGGESKTITVRTNQRAPKVVLAKGATWNYETSGVESPGWTNPTFDDSAWGVGPAQLGHGEGDEATALTPFMSDGTTRRITTYFRGEFNLTSAADVKELAMALKRDDGVVIYLNGKEVYRNNMPTGAITAETVSSTFAQDDGQTFFSGVLPTSELVDGKNTIAVEVHQNHRTSLDLTFDMELTAKF